MSLRFAAVPSLVLVAVITSAGPSDARKAQRHRHAVATVESVRRSAIPYTFSFYPEEVEDGVSGNLPFNNQIRKFKDPLNANGAGG